ncbi:MAG: twin-arginine translocase subunit TatC [Eubacteriales bacterium]|nr:twin-arginine translocase subunit TatC [Eubacteriales bacterium]
MRRISNTGGKTGNELTESVRRWWDRPDPPMEAKPLSTHLIALRKTLIVCLAAVGIAFLLLFLLASKWLVSQITAPIIAQGIDIVFTDVSEAFAAQVKLSLIMAVVVASPVLTGAIWLFIRPALRRKERVMAGCGLLAALLLFAVGVVFAYRYVFFLAVNFFIYAGEGVAVPLLSVGTYTNFLFGFVVPFGVTFELPLVLVFLTRWGLVSARSLRKARKFVIFGIAIVAAILTPPDVVSQVMLGVPLWALYEIGVLLAWLLRPREEKTAYSTAQI